jgi:hypothetical protein
MNAMNHLTNDRPRFDDSKTIAAERESDHLKAGDIIQQWAVKNVGGQVKWRWIDGNVLAVVEKPCGGDGAPAWVALIQWRENNEVKGWGAIPEHEWIDRVTLRRKTHEMTEKAADKTNP